MNKIKLNNFDKNAAIKRYNDRLKEFGYSPKTLGWYKGKQDLRFDILTSQLILNNKSILDIGCGFGDLNKTLKQKADNYEYLGIDINENLIKIGKEKYKGKNIKFMTCEFLEENFDEKFDFIIESGIFNYEYKEIDNYTIIESTIVKALELCNEGLAFDFSSDTVDYKYDNCFYANPGKILSIAYKYSRNIILRNDYMPFEFCLFIFKDDSFEKADTIFNRYKQVYRYTQND